MYKILFKGAPAGWESLFGGFNDWPPNSRLLHEAADIAEFHAMLALTFPSAIEYRQPLEKLKHGRGLQDTLHTNGVKIFWFGTECYILTAPYHDYHLGKNIGAFILKGGYPPEEFKKLYRPSGIVEDSGWKTIPSFQGCHDFRRTIKFHHELSEQELEMVLYWLQHESGCPTPPELGPPGHQYHHPSTYVFTTGYDSGD